MWIFCFLFWGAGVGELGWVLGGWIVKTRVFGDGMGPFFLENEILFVGGWRSCLGAR